MKKATDHLETLVQDIKNQNPKTLAYWRVTHEPIYKVLHDFATTDSDSDDSSAGLDTLLPQVQEFFDALNAQLSLQESQDADYQAYLKSINTTDGKKSSMMSDNVSIAFGGKYPAEGKPRSISERLVTKLTTGGKEANVITVSRSNISYALPSNCQHVALQSLDHADVSVGSVEFGQVLEMAGLEPKKDGDVQGLTLYLTLGQHKGVDPFRRNLYGANNFCTALEKYLNHTETNGMKRKNACRWKVVLTGTDATLPSDHPASPVELSKETLQIPSYKIMKYNFTYAMSKLGQCFLLIKAVAQLTGRTEVVQEVEPIVAKIQASVHAAGENGNYSPPESNDQEIPATFISMEELDQYSKRSMELERELGDHLQFAKGISICYTPLHAVPWTQQAIASINFVDSLSPKAFVLEQVVKRLKNAISIDQAVECHFQ